MNKNKFDISLSNEILDDLIYKYHNSYEQPLKNGYIDMYINVLCLIFTFFKK